MTPSFRIAVGLLLAVSVGLADGPPASTVVGTLNLHDIDSQSLGKKRTIRVWLPPGYDADPAARFDVLYLHDGQNCFDRHTTAFGTEWQIDETLTRLIADKTVRPLIVVGVDHGGVDRVNELTFAVDPKHGGGRGERYAAFLLNEVMPFVNATYRTNTGPAHTVIGGSSLGGLASIELARRHPGVFGGVMAMSPSIWWAGGKLATDLEADAKLAGVRVWIDAGTREGTGDDPARTVADVHRVDEALRRAGVEHRLTIDEGAEHNEAAWAKRFPAAIRYLVPTAKD